MPVLDWIWKEKVVNHHLDVPFKVLEKQYTYKDGSVQNDSESDNKIIHGDNLEALKALLPEYEGRIKCIYIDPPYNTGNEKWVYNDNVNDPRIKKWLGEVVGTEGEDLTRHDKWLCMMYPRLKLLQRLLSDDGAIFISIDDNEQANLKLICDEIFGSQNFVGNIAWESKTKSQNTMTAFQKLQPKVEHIFCYANGGTKYKFNLIEVGKKDYNLEDDKGKYREHTLEIMNANGVRGRATMVFDISDGVSTVSLPNGKQWKLGQDQVAKYKNRRDLFIRDNKVIIRMRPEDERDAQTQPFWAFYDKTIGTAESGKKELNLIIGDDHGFETVKPSQLIENLLFHATDKDSIVLDSFAGSGTTAHAVLNLNKADGGSRKFILIEMMDYAESITAERVKRVIGGYGTDKNKVEGTGGNFAFYELGKPLLVNNLINEEVDVSNIREYIWFTETHTKLPAQNGAAAGESEYFLGSHNRAGYWFYYEKNRITTLDYSFLRTMKTKSDQYIIYADVCLLSQDFMRKNSIVFKKIPRDMQRF